jgi:hypothetical protein
MDQVAPDRVGESSKRMMSKSKSKIKRKIKRRRRRGPFFWIYGHLPNSEHLLSGWACGHRQLLRKISQLFEQEPKVIFVEILRYRSMQQSEQEIRDAVGIDRRVKPVPAPPGMTSQGQTLH